MRSVSFGFVILVAVPAYAQQRDSSKGSATGRTAVPRNDVQAAPARHTDRRVERREETETPARRDDKAEDARPSRKRHTRRSGAETVRDRAQDERLQAAAAHARWWGSPSIQYNPSSILRRPGSDGNYRSGYRRRHSEPNVVFVPYVAPVVVEREVVDAVSAAPVIVEQPSPARLILDVHPPNARVFADGYYIGIPDDFQAHLGGAMLEPGPHRIDIAAPGYESLSFEVNLTRGQSATFRHTLAPMAPPQPAAPDTLVKALPAAKKPMTFYLIRGCYMGNVPPAEAKLPATCDIARAVSIQY